MLDDHRKNTGRIIGVAVVAVGGSVLAGMAIRAMKIGAVEYETATEYLADGSTKNKVIRRKRGGFLQKMKLLFKDV
ncbi:MAG: hypothetical protein LUE14_13630 [Clostridiales bacterium]|nr:hypothetical protein [Clostridiales bacterium]